MSCSQKQKIDSPNTSASISSSMDASSSSTTSDQEEPNWVAEEVRQSSSVYTEFDHVIACFPYLTRSPYSGSFDVFPCQEGMLFATLNLIQTRSVTLTCMTAFLTNLEFVYHSLTFNVKFYEFLMWLHRNFTRTPGLSFAPLRSFVER
jgi:hypothetical protein